MKLSGGAIVTGLAIAAAGIFAFRSKPANPAAPGAPGTVAPRTLTAWQPLPASATGAPIVSQPAAPAPPLLAPVVVLAPPVPIAPAAPSAAAASAAAAAAAAQNDDFARSMVQARAEQAALYDREVARLAQDLASGALPRGSADHKSALAYLANLKGGVATYQAELDKLASAGLT